MLCASSAYNVVDDDDDDDDNVYSFDVYVVD